MKEGKQEGWSSDMDPHEEAELDLILPRGRAFWIGIGLMAISFSFLPVSAVLFYFYLPIPSDTMLGMLVGGWIVSWGLLFVGTLLAGKEGYPYLKQLVRKRFQKR